MEECCALQRHCSALSSPRAGSHKINWTKRVWSMIPETVQFENSQLLVKKHHSLSTSPHPPPFSTYKKIVFLKILTALFSPFCLLKPDLKVPPSVLPFSSFRNLAAFFFDISKQLRLFLPTLSCSLNLFNPVECKLIYSEEGTRPILAAGARNVRAGKRINKLVKGKGEPGPASAESRLSHAQR